MLLMVLVIIYPFRFATYELIFEVKNKHKIFGIFNKNWVSFIFIN